MYACQHVLSTHSGRVQAYRSSAPRRCTSAGAGTRERGRGPAAPPAVRLPPPATAAPPLGKLRDAHRTRAGLPTMARVPVSACAGVWNTDWKPDLPRMLWTEGRHVAPLAARASAESATEASSSLIRAQRLRKDWSWSPPVAHNSLRNRVVRRFPPQSSCSHFFLRFVLPRLN